MRPRQGLRVQAQAEFRAQRSVNYNLFALQHAIDKSLRSHMPLYCCFVDLTAAFDRVPRSLLWERLRSCGVSKQMLAAIQALYSDAHIVINIDGCIGDSTTLLSGVKQGRPLRPIRLEFSSMPWWVGLTGDAVPSPHSGAGPPASLVLVRLKRSYLHSLIEHFHV